MCKSPAHSRKEPPRQTFAKLAAAALPFFYHPFDRVVLHGYLFFFHREVNVAWCFRQVLGLPPTQQALCARPRDCVRFVGAYARKRRLTPGWVPTRDPRKEALVRPRLESARRRRRFGL